MMDTNVISFIEHELSKTISEQLKAQIKRPFAEMARELSREIKQENTTRVVYPPPDRTAILEAKREVHEFQRRLLINFHKTGTFNQSTIRILEQELDYEELQLSRSTRQRDNPH